MPLLTAQEVGFPKMLLNTHTIFEPRFGFAWRPRGSATSVLRGGYGLYTANTVGVNTYFGSAAAVQTAGPFQQSYSFTNSPGGQLPIYSFPNPFTAISGGGPVPVNAAQAFDPNWGPSLAHNASLTYERMVFGDWGVRGTYNIVRTTGVTWLRDLNQKPVNTTSWAQSLRPYPAWNSLTRGENGGNAIYHSLMFQLLHQWAGGLWFQGSYQWRWDREDVARPAWEEFVQAGPVYDSYNRRYDWGRSGVLAAHDVVVNWVWEVPVGTGKKYLGDLSSRGIGGKLLNGLLGNWASTGSFSIRSGDFFTLQYTGYDAGNINTNAGRPDRVSGCDPMAGRSLQRWFNPACFKLPAKGTLGNEMRNSLAGPMLWGSCSTLTKTSPYRGSVSKVGCASGQISTTSSTTQPFLLRTRTSAARPRAS